MNFRLVDSLYAWCLHLRKRRKIKIPTNLILMKGCFYFVGFAGVRLTEAKNINKSLSALGDVINALATKACHVPYRNSKLTRLLQDSLGKSAKVLMIVQISPTVKDAQESHCSLLFAERARGVELGPAKRHLKSCPIPDAKSQVSIQKGQEHPAALIMFRATKANEFFFAMTTPDFGASQSTIIKKQTY